MTKRDFLLRYLLIIKKLRNSRTATFSEINEYIKREFELMDSPKEISVRTFQRDLNDIRTIFNIDIKCNRLNYYYIEEDEHAGFNNRMMEAFDLFNSFNQGQSFTPYLLLENRRSLGTEHIYGLMHAIRNSNIVKFDYQKYYDTQITHRETEPYALKEFKGRWYLLAKDSNDNVVKTFALDRILEIELSKKRFVYPENLKPNQLFEHCFGIIIPEDDEPQEIILSFNPFQGKYIKSFPLHSSQKTIIDNDQELRISLYVYETHDLLMELLSYGANLKVIQPKSLSKTIAMIADDLYKIYLKQLIKNENT